MGVIIAATAVLDIMFVSTVTTKMQAISCSMALLPIRSTKNRAIISPAPESFMPEAIPEAKAIIKTEFHSTPLSTDSLKLTHPVRTTTAAPIRATVAVSQIPRTKQTTQKIMVPAEIQVL